MKKLFQRAAADLPASIVVFLVAVPLCLGVAVASGVPAFSGLIAGVVGGVVVGFLSKSQLSVSGPAAGLTAIVAAAVIKLPVVEAFFLAVVLAGIFQIIMGIGKLGVIGDYVPNSVIKGMLAAIGIILILKQLPYLIGYITSFEGDETFNEASGGNTFSSLFEAFQHITPIAVIIGVAGLAILILFESKFIKSKKIFNVLSGPLVVVMMGVLVNMFFGSSMENTTGKTAALVAIPVANSAMEFLSFFQLPQWSAISNPDVWITAVTLALVASLETLLGIEAVDKLDPMKRVTPANRELVAQGTGNIISGFLGGLPITSVIVRSSANVNAGAKSNLSTIFHGLLILLFVFFVPNLLNLIPLAALAAILVFTGYKLAKLTLFKDYYKKGWDQFIPFVVTILAIVFTDLLKGVLIGIGTGIFYIIRSNFRTAIFTVKDKGHYLIRLRKDISFFSKPKLKKQLELIPNNSTLMIDLTKAEFIDKDIVDTINEFLKHAHLKNIEVTVNKTTYNDSHQLVETKGRIYDDMAH